MKRKGSSKSHSMAQQIPINPMTIIKTETMEESDTGTDTTTSRGGAITSTPTSNRRSSRNKNHKPCIFCPKMLLISASGINPRKRGKLVQNMINYLKIRTGAKKIPDTLPSIMCNICERLIKEIWDLQVSLDKAANKFMKRLCLDSNLKAEHFVPFEGFTFDVVIKDAVKKYTMKNDITGGQQTATTGTMVEHKSRSSSPGDGAGEVDDEDEDDDDNDNDDVEEEANNSIGGINASVVMQSQPSEELPVASTSFSPQNGNHGHQEETERDEDVEQPGPTSSTSSAAVAGTSGVYIKQELTERDQAAESDGDAESNEEDGEQPEPIPSTSSSAVAGPSTLPIKLEKEGNQAAESDSEDEMDTGPEGNQSYTILPRNQRFIVSDQNVYDVTVSPATETYHQCSLCQYTIDKYQVRKRMRIHMKKAHEGATPASKLVPFSCNYCLKECKTREKLIEHKKIHGTASPKIIKGQNKSVRRTKRGSSPSSAPESPVQKRWVLRSDTQRLLQSQTPP